MERETQIRAPAKHDSPLVVLLARVESTIRHPRRSRRRGVDAFRKLSGRAISSTRVPFSSLSAFYASIGRARRVAALASNFSFHSAGFASFSLSLLAHARTHAHARPIDASTCPPPRARFHRLARINVRAQKPTADPSRYTTHRGLSSEGRKPGNYYVSRETRGNPDFFFFSLPSRILKGSSSSIREKLFTRCEFFFFSRGRDIISLARIRVLLLREMCYRGNLNYYSRGSVFSSFLFRRVEGNYPRLKIFYGFHWG